MARVGVLARSRRKLPKGGELRHGVGGCETTQSIYQQPSFPTTKNCLPIQSQPRQANSPTGSELVQRLWLLKGIYFTNPRTQWVEITLAQTVTRQRATLDRISTPARRTWPERISASVCRLILILFQVELTIHDHAVMLLTRSMSGETPDLHCHMSIWQRLGFVGVEYTGDAPPNGNAEVLLGPSRVSMPIGALAFHPGYARAVDR
jgi:hypothetical protein